MDTLTLEWLTRGWIKKKMLGVTMTAYAMKTKKIVLGPIITDPFSRIPAMQAVAAATVNEISSGRFVFTYGAGGPGFSDMGVERKKPWVALKEAVEIVRGLLAGKTLDYDGEFFKLRRASIGFETRSVPINVASRSPKVLQAAGRVADGAVIGSYTSEEGVKYAIENIRKGAESAGRKLADIDLISWSYVSVSKDGKTALENVKPFASHAVINTSSEAYTKVGFTDDERSRIEELKKRYYSTANVGFLRLKKQ